MYSMRSGLRLWWWPCRQHSICGWFVQPFLPGVKPRLHPPNVMIRGATMFMLLPCTFQHVPVLASGPIARLGEPLCVLMLHPCGGLSRCCFSMLVQVIFCASARSTFTGELNRVEERGVRNVLTALQDEYYRRDLKAGRKIAGKAKKEVADFARSYHHEKWNVDYCGLPDADKGLLGKMLERNVNTAVAEITEGDNLVFSGERCGSHQLHET